MLTILSIIAAKILENTIQILNVADYSLEIVIKLDYPNSTVSGSKAKCYHGYS